MLQGRLLDLMGETSSWVADSREMEDLKYRRGYLEGVERTVKLLDSLLGLAQEEAMEIEAAQEEIERRAS